RALRGDLDWIVARAIEKDRTRRYGSPGSLGDDVSRYLQHEPVVAGPPNSLYRAGKLIRRHRVAFIAAAAVFITLILGVIGTTIGFLRAQSESSRAQSKERRANIEATRSAQTAAMLKDMLAGVGPQVALGRDTTMLREMLDRTAARVATDTTEPE